MEWKGHQMITVIVAVAVNDWSPLLSLLPVVGRVWRWMFEDMQSNVNTAN